MKTAKTIEHLHGVDNPLFMEEYILCCNSENGLIPYSLLEEEDKSLRRSNDDTYECGNLSQETCGVDEKETDNGYARSMVTGASLYVDCNSQLQHICNLIENDFDISNRFRSKFLSIITESRSEIMLKTKDKSDDNNEWVSCNPEVDTDAVCVRKKAIHEFVGNKKAKRNYSQSKNNRNDDGSTNSF